MTTRFERAHAHTSRWEIGKVDDPDDPGLATNDGISLRFLRSLDEIERWDHDGDGDIDADDVMDLDEHDKRILFRENFWRSWFDELESETLAIKLYDFGVNMGPRQRNKLAQRAFNELVEPVDRLFVDGRLGPLSMEAIANNCDPDECRLMLGDLEDGAARFYFGLAEKRRQSRRYLFGWLRRCYDRPEV